MAGMLAKVKDRFASRRDGGNIIGGLRIPARRVRSANRARENDALRREQRQLEHGPSEEGNAFGGYNCLCGEPWLESYGGCVNARAEGRG